jgi:hypothetical protein
MVAEGYGEVVVYSEFGRQFSFPQRFEVRPGELPASPAGGRVLYYPGGSEKGGNDGPILEALPHDAASWIGVFAAGKYGAPAVQGELVGWPDGASLCVVTEGRGYVVRADEPTEWFEIALYPITEVRVAVEERLVVFADFTNLVAYGADGLAWETPRLSWDGLRISEIVAGEIRGLGWDAADEDWASFTVDARTGESAGGASPDRQP